MLGSVTPTGPKEASQPPRHERIGPTDSSVAAASSSGTDANVISRPGPLLKKRFTSSWARKRNQKDEDEGGRGPVGLRLLHFSPEPLIDLIFVHGLRGGSIKTWRKGKDPRYFWPQLWLPTDRDFHNVNIHSFGYDSDWASTTPSILNVHDFGQSLLEEMRNSPYLRGNRNAYILAKDVPDFKDRIRCIFFLATPHRGSDYAATLNNILMVSGVMSSRPYIRDLTTGSTSTELINNDFGKYANDLQIFSFYETIRMNLGISSGLIVEKRSGFKNERVQYLNANHRDICKFDGLGDPNYITLKNALVGAIQDLSKDILVSRNLMSKEHMKILKTFLGVWHQPEEHYPKVSGSCDWVGARDDYQDWRDPSDELLSAADAKMECKAPSYYWVHANPGTGKSFLAAHVVSELQESKLECSHYFFHVGNITSCLAHFLRSIAYQMAVSNALIREKLISLQQEGSFFDIDDHGTIWTKVFKRGIFQVGHLNRMAYSRY
ncbi:hypothetical protein DL771_004851 [Monosporascus sp. 5C6A]|nr:hypothetical protein DL771_004851 [Monosporascus sp. 5C6A]